MNIIILYEVDAVGTDINKCLCEVVRSIPRKTAMIRKVGIPEGINPVKLERELNNALRDFESMLQDDGIRREIEFIAKNKSPSFSAGFGDENRQSRSLKGYPRKRKNPVLRSQSG
jgi:uncharacterized protein with von Willebrand factor type A (vWA) domain